MVCTLFRWSLFPFLFFQLIFHVYWKPTAHSFTHSFTRTSAPATGKWQKYKQKHSVAVLACLLAALLPLLPPLPVSCCCFCFRLNAHEWRHTLASASVQANWSMREEEGPLAGRVLYCVLFCVLDCVLYYIVRKGHTQLFCSACSVPMCSLSVRSRGVAHFVC